MRVTNWRWWQWLVASLLVGVGIGFALTRLDPDDPSLPSTPFSMMRQRIEQRTDAGDSILTQIRVGPAAADNTGKPVQSVTYWERQRNRTTGQWMPTRKFRTMTTVPLSPVSPRPDFGVMDYLGDRKKDIPTLDYQFQWWLLPRNIWIGSIAGSVLLIGVLWPLLIKLMVRLGLAEPPEARGDALGAVRVTDTSTALSTGQAVSADDQRKLADLNAEMELNVAGMSVGSNAGTAGDRPHADAPVKSLGTGDAALPAPVATTIDQPRDFKGEFYPVAKPVVKKD